MDKIVFFNIAWMKYYRGVTLGDTPKHGGEYIEENGFGSEVYNFQPYNGKMYGFVEAGWNNGQKLCNININMLGANSRDSRVSGILVVWVARHGDHPGTVVVGWYKNATIHRERQNAPEGSNRKLPDGGDAIYFAEADRHNCHLIPVSGRNFNIPRARSGQEGIGQKNIWYADSEFGKKVKSKVLENIRSCGN
jgi:hypothetical protein